MNRVSEGLPGVRQAPWRDPVWEDAGQMVQLGRVSERREVTTQRAPVALCAMWRNSDQSQVRKLSELRSGPDAQIGPMKETDVGTWG